MVSKKKKNTLIVDVNPGGKREKSHDKKSDEEVSKPEFYFIIFPILEILKKKESKLIDNICVNFFYFCSIEMNLKLIKARQP